MSIELALRLVGGVLAGILAWQVAVGQIAGQFADPATAFIALFAVVAASFGIFFVIAPYLTTRPFYWLLDTASHATASDLVVGALGLLFGLLVGTLIAVSIGSLPPPLGQFLPLVVTLALGYLGFSTAFAQKQALLALIGMPWGIGRGAKNEPQRVVLDTSAIIDGRVADITRTGFLDGPLMVPRFVLTELQRIADSPDGLRRARGRRGLDVLTRMQKDSTIQLEIIEEDGDSMAEVDAQLIALARIRRCPILTNDFNLNRVAALQGVKVLNVNELANAVRSVVLPGEEVTLRVIQEGKEFGQGVGYLEDGTMVVVENGRHLLNSSADVVVTRVLQTAAGRMVFATARPPYNGNRSS